MNDESAAIAMADSVVTKFLAYFLLLSRTSCYSLQLATWALMTAIWAEWPGQAVAMGG